MTFTLKWGNSSWLYGLALGLGLGTAILLLMHNMFGVEFFFNYYSPMLGYYVLISICQSHYFRRNPEPDMGGLFRQFVSIFGAIVIFFINEMIMIHIFGVPEQSNTLLYHGGMVMSGHFTFIVFGFFIYGFDDFMFKGRLVGWIKKDLVKAVFWYLFIWLSWGILYYMKGGLVQAYSLQAFDQFELYRMLGISQWIIIMSLMLALVLKDYMPELKKKLRLKSEILFGIFLLIGSAVVGTAIAYFCFGLTEYIAPWDDLDASSKWHHVLYMGTFPLTPIVLMGLYTNNFNGTVSPLKRVVKRVALLVPVVFLSYFSFHLIIAEPELLPNWMFPNTFGEGIGLFGNQHGWHHHLDLYFNFTVSIIPLTHHWFCGKAGFVEEKRIL